MSSIRELPSTTRDLVDSVRCRQKAAASNTESRSDLNVATSRVRLDRLRRDLRRIRRRDYFPPPEQESARHAVETLAARAGQPAPPTTAGDRA